jgi:hypothetical protein
LQKSSLAFVRATLGDLTHFDLTRSFRDLSEALEESIGLILATGELIYIIQLVDFATLAVAHLTYEQHDVLFT